ncbi:MAG: DUF1624 domain-containing protein [Clostridiales bacterium]|jgi:uncharacterized membrane protein|nr:DUF1624 domain-containing protein [Clostridiales bacterium]HOB64649.1 heparan-alpha-glucosaminide N-acetyltransferase domain-containing protein [Clostridia bacterium]
MRRKDAQPKIKKQRAWEIDFLRGFAIIMVVWDHTLFDLGYIFGDYWMSSGYAGLAGAAKFAQTYFRSDLRNFWWPFFVFVFFFVAGICTVFSRNNFSRGLKVALAAALISGVTYVLEFYVPGSFILFGVLHCLASCMLIFSLIEFMVKLCNRKNKKWVLPVVCLCITIAAFVLDRIYNVTLSQVVRDYASNSYDSPIAGLFVFEDSWWSADYFPLLPFFWFFMLGSVIGNVFYSKKKSLLPKLDGKWHYFFTVPGKYTLAIYIFSQVIVLALLLLVTYIVTGGIPFEL